MSSDFDLELATYLLSDEKTKIAKCTINYNGKLNYFALDITNHVDPAILCKDLKWVIDRCFESHNLPTQTSDELNKKTLTRARLLSARTAIRDIAEVIINYDEESADLLELNQIKKLLEDIK